MRSAITLRHLQKLFQKGRAMRGVTLLGIVSAGLVFSIIATGGADDPENEPEKAPNDDLSVRRFELMQKRIADVKVTSDEKNFPAAFTAKPIFRYTDPVRGYVSAGVWKLGDERRPKAIIAAELHRINGGQPKMAHEFLSLTQIPFSATIDGVQWEPAGTTLDFKPIGDAAPPEDTPQRRLAQIRAIAKRFAGDEVQGTERNA